MIRVLSGPIAKVCYLPDYTPKPLADEPEFLENDCTFSAFGDVTVTGLDTASCRRVSYYFIADKNLVYKQLYDPGSSDIADYIVVSEADPESFTKLGWGFFSDSKNIYYDTGKDYQIVNNMDLSSFEVLSPHLVKDKNGIYFSQIYQGKEPEKISGFDLNSFAVLQIGKNNESYFKDRNGVYYAEAPWLLDPEKSRIPEADIESFEAMGVPDLAKDKYNVFFQGEKVGVKDPSTFMLVTDYVYKDIYRVYSIIGGRFTLLPGRDGCTYEVLGYDYEFGWGSGYSKDKNDVYYQDLVVEGADKRTFKVEGERAYDKNYEYNGAFRAEN